MYLRDTTLDDRLENAAVGAAVGAVVGLGLKKFIRQYEWSDVAAASVLGLSVGASAKGSGLGFAAGSVVGLLLWRFHPSVGPGWNGRRRTGRLGGRCCAGRL